ncbi:hypothetical protein [Labrys sp. 22185]|uniref:hypothetical protein n=1 Tax=Labrys sp. 22185 TaxID=3453888 RepID=UPI003F879BE5
MSASSDKRLWAAVIHQAIVDATATVTASSGGISEYEVMQARNWFERAGPDFRRACALADLEPDYVRTKALAAIAACDAGEKIQRKPEKPVPGHSVRTHLYQGKPYTIAELVKLSGLKYSMITWRLNNGWTVEQAVSTPKRKPGTNWGSSTARKPTKRYDYEGRKITISEMAAHCGVSRPAIHQRLSKGWSIEKIMQTPASSNNLAYYEGLRDAT